MTVATCNGAGKTTLLSKLAHWFLSTREDAKVLTTAGMGAQMRILWKKIHASHAGSRYPLGGELLTTELRYGPEWYGLGIATDQETNLQGYHSTGDDDTPGAPGGLLAIVDEASGCKPWVFDAIQGWMTRANTYWIVCGNPNESTGPFAETFERGDWTRFQISAFDVPGNIISREWIEGRRAYWGEDTPQYQVRVLGQFPTAGSDRQVFPMALFEDTADDTFPPGARHMGVDVARSIDRDRSAIVVQDNGKVIHVEAWRSKDMMAVAAHVGEVAARLGVDGSNIHVDETGVGSGVLDRLRELGLPADGVVAGGSPVGDWPSLVGQNARAANRRAELYWVARMSLIEHKASVPREYRETLWREASNVQSLDPGQSGQIRIEPKERIRSRLGESPDFTDAWVMSFARSGSGRFRIYAM